MNLRRLAAFSSSSTFSAYLRNVNIVINIAVASAVEQFANLARSNGFVKGSSKDSKGSLKGVPKGYSKGLLKGSPARLSKGRGKFPGPKNSITKQQAMNLQRELYLGFREDAFQQRLQALRDGYDPDSPEYVVARQRLFLLVQAPILPKYGFEGSLAGVFKMMTAMQPFIHDSDFVALAAAVNEMMEIDLPPEAWSDVTFTLSRRSSGTRALTNF